MDVDSSKKFSPSRLGTFKDCPRLYRYRYIDKIPSDAESVEAFLGQCAHKALETLYKALQNGRRMTLDETLKAFEDSWERGWSDAIVIRKEGMAPENYRRIGREAVSLYYANHEPFESDKTVATERRVNFPLDVEALGESFTIEGFIDRLALAPDGAFEIHDYKTSQTLPAQADLEQDWQLPIYEIAVRRAWPDAKSVRLIWHYLRYGKSLTVSKTPESLAAIKHDVSELIVRIKREREFAPRKSALCAWCDYKPICPLWAHAEKLSNLSPREASKDEGARLVDALADIHARKKSLREGLAELEASESALHESLIRLAGELGVLALYGRKGSATISEKENWHLPVKTRDPEAYERLEGELKAGPLWKDVSRFDSHRLLEGLKKEEWPPEEAAAAQEILARYGRREIERAVRFHPKSEGE